MLLIKSNKLTAEDQAIIHAWIQQITAHGPESIRGAFKWADHALHGEWAPYWQKKIALQDLKYQRK
ncbi:MAG: hypothetical protein ACOYOK_08410 [Pseudobdellovibrionaceae bacterium]